MNKNIARWLRELLKFRDSEHRELMELNSFSYRDDARWQDEDKLISEAIHLLETED